MKALLAAGVVSLALVVTGSTVYASPTKDDTRAVTASYGSALGPKSGPEVRRIAITLCPETAYGSQAALDTGALVLWDTTPAYWLAGHNVDGWDWMDDIPEGTRVEVTCGPAAGEYEVYDHQWLDRQEGHYPDWAYNGPDLIMQTCTASGGTGFSLLKEV